MENKHFKEGAENGAPVKELQWMAEFLASHGQTKKALEIYRALVQTLTEKNVEGSDRSRRNAA